MPAPVSTKTVLDVVTNVQRQFGDESGVQIVNADIIRWINQAQMEICNKTPILEATAVTPSIIGTQTYAVPPLMIELNSVMFDGNILEARNFETIRTELGIDNATPGVPCYWYTWANMIYLWPIPDSVKDISINYSKAPTNVTGLGDLLGVPDRYYDRVCEYVKAAAYELDEDWAAHGLMKQTFENKLTEGTNSDKVIYGAWFVANDSEYL